MDQNSKSFVIPGTPVPLKRPRINFKSGKVYDEQSQYKNSIQLLLLSQRGRAPLFQGPLKISLSFYFMWREGKDFYHTSVPDLSNLIKMVEDIATGILYNDDCIIAEISAVKCYSPSSRTEFTITELARGEKYGDDKVLKPTEYSI